MFNKVILASAFAAVVSGAAIQKRDSSTGAATWFWPGQGACGWYNSESDWIVAVNSAQYDGGSHCGQTVTVTANGNTHIAQVADECPTCDYGQLDMSPSFFSQFGDLQTGEFSIEWYFNGGSQKREVASSESASLVKRDEHSGKATWFNPGQGNCGGYNSDNDMVVALSTDLYGSTSAQSGYCWKYVNIEYQGKTVTAQIVDSCPTCEGSSLDLSPAVFSQLSSLDAGLIDINWSFTGSADGSSTPSHSGQKHW